MSRSEGAPIPIEPQKEQRAEIWETWRNAIIVFQKIADKSGKNPDEICHYASIEDDDFGKLSIRVNGAITNDEGKLKTMVVDVSKENKHSQQVVLEAGWRNDQITEIKGDFSAVMGGEVSMDEGTLAATVLTFLRMSEEQDDQSESEVEMIAPNPMNSIRVPGYSSGTN